MDVKPMRGMMCVCVCACVYEAKTAPEGERKGTGWRWVEGEREGGKDGRTMVDQTKGEGTSV